MRQGLQQDGVGTRPNGLRLNPIRQIGLRAFAKTLRETGPALTFARLCTSQHLEDLQWLAFVMLLAMVVALCIWIFNLAGGVSGTLAAAFFAAEIAVLNWCYQSGSRRIGAVDLFACEISAICRVALVVDYARNCVDQARAPLVPEAIVAPRRFSSAENYTQVYDRALGDLVPLDVNVVTHVTAFYTYRKTMMDQLRLLADGGPTETVRTVFIQMIYMQFLMFESARLALTELIEFEPNQAEALVNVLCSELPLFGFLLKHFDGDYRGQRLTLRCAQYRSVVTKLYDGIQAGTDEVWDRARSTAAELKVRYETMCTDVGLVSDLGVAAPAVAA